MAEKEYADEPPDDYYREGVQLILLLKYDEYTYEQIADKLDVCLSAVKSCVQRFLDGGIDAALHDRKGRGRKPEISDSDITWVINKACKRPKDHGYAAELWYPASFTRFIHSTAKEEGHPRMATVSESTLRKILKKAKIPFNGQTHSSASSHNHKYIHQSLPDIYNNPHRKHPDF